MNKEAFKFQIVVTLFFATLVGIFLHLVYISGARLLWDRTPKVNLASYQDAPISFYFPNGIQSVARGEIDNIEIYANPHKNFSSWILGKNEGITIIHHPDKYQIRMFMKKCYKENKEARIRTDLISGNIFYMDPVQESEFNVDEVTEFVYNSLLNNDVIIDMVPLCEPIEGGATRRFYNKIKWVNNWSLEYVSESDVATVEFNPGDLGLNAPDNYDELANPTKENMKEIVDQIILRTASTYNTSTTVVDIQYERERVTESLLSKENFDHKWTVQTKKRQ